MPFIGTQPEIGGYSVLDALTASATANYTLQLNSANFSPASANQLLVSLNGVIQKPGSSFTVSGSTLSFSSALTSSDSIDFIIAMGEPLLIGTPSDGTITTNKLVNDSVTGAKIENNPTIAGNLTVSGNVTGQGTAAITSNATVGGTLGVTGATTLSGNLTVDTNVLQVNSTTNRVGIGATSLADTESLLDLGSGENTGFKRKLLITNTGNSRAGFGAESNKLNLFMADDQNLHIQKISRDGNFTATAIGTFKNSGGLCFGTDTADANALDDYEEGTWTPTLSDGSSTLGTAQVNGKYRKIGTLVHAEFYFQRNDSSSNTATMILQGLPFAHGAFAALVGQVWIDNTSSDIRCMLYLPTNYQQLYYTKTGASSSYVSLNEFDNGRYQYGAFTYIVQ